VGLLPLYAWVGAGADLTAGFAAVVVLAVAAGTALALANAYADLHRDELSGTRSIATVLGARSALRADVMILVAVQVVAGATTLGSVGPSLPLAFEAAGSLLAWLGICVAIAGRGRASHLVWELQGIGIAVMGAAWLWAMSSAGVLQP
jgi:4-hydroxybenzoate polyprenyltransferase